MRLRKSDFLRLSRGIVLSLCLWFLTGPAMPCGPAAEDVPARVAVQTKHVPAKFYVDSRDGDDTNAGTLPEKPWKSLEKLNNTTFQAGDTILLRAGCVWDGQLWPKGSGEEGKSIRIGKYGSGAKPLIQGKGLVEDALLLKNQEYWEIEDLEVTNYGTTKAIRRGVHLAIENFGEAHHLVVRRVTIHDVSGRDDAKNNGGITYTADGEQKPSRFLDLRIEDNEIYHSDRNGISGWSDRWERSKWYPSLGVVVRGNTLRDIGGDGIMIVATDGAVIEKNVVGYANQRSEGYNIAIWSWSADNTLIQYNEAYSTKGQRDGEGFDSDWNSRNTVIQYNYSHDNEGGFVLICDDGGQSSTYNAGNVGTIVRYNISQNDQNRGITLSGPVKDTRIYNNTIYVSMGRGVDVVLFTDWDGWPEKTAFVNNIFWATREARIGHAIARAKDGQHTSAPGFGESRGNVFDANVYFGLVTHVEDAHAFTADPLIMAVGTGGLGRRTLEGYALRGDSAARKTGKLLEKNGGKDFWGHVIEGCAAIDRGAVQSSSCNAP